LSLFNVNYKPFVIRKSLERRSVVQQATHVGPQTERRGVPITSAILCSPCKGQIKIAEYNVSVIKCGMNLTYVTRAKFMRLWGPSAGTCFVIFLLFISFHPENIRSDN